MAQRAGRDSEVSDDSRGSVMRQESGVGKRTQVQEVELQLDVQRRGNGPDLGNVQAAAVHGTSGVGAALPHLDTIQRLFGQHDASQIQAHTDRAAHEGATAMGAAAYATGDRVAFASTPDLHRAAHEASHVVQQRNGVQLEAASTAALPTRTSATPTRSPTR